MTSKYHGQVRGRAWIQQKVRSLRRGEWIGVDLDGTLATYDGFKGADVIGDPIPKTAALVRSWIENGLDVRILTARVTAPDAERDGVVPHIEAWCLEHFGKVLPVTATKDWLCAFFLDDRCIQVVPDTGELVWDRVSDSEALIDELVDELALTKRGYLE